jgi:hypothetical protein
MKSIQRKYDKSSSSSERSYDDRYKSFQIEEKHHINFLLVSLSHKYRHQHISKLKQRSSKTKILKIYHLPSKISGMFSVFCLSIKKKICYSFSSIIT